MPYEVKRESKDLRRAEVMTEDEMKEIDKLLITLTQNGSNMAEIYEQWNKEDEAYRADQPKVAKRPNTRVNIVNANIEGQIAMLVEQNLSAMVKGEAPGDEKFAEWGRIGIEWALRKNKIKPLIAMHERRRLKHGAAFLKISWDADAFKGFGMPKLTNPSGNRMLIDQKIKNPLDYQQGEYVAEIMRMSHTYIEDTYGQEIADAIDYGEFFLEDQIAFVEPKTYDDEDGATIIQFWSRKKKKLRCREFSACGVLMYDSMRDKSRGNRGGGKVAPYYKHVDNRYPYIYTFLYPVEGSLWGFGDGKLLMPLQNLLNDMYDKIRLTAKPNLVLFDPASEVDLEDFDTDSLAPVPCFNPTAAVTSVSWGQVNESWWRLLTAIHDEIQRVTRFSAIMMGQRISADSATEAAIQQQQGNAATDHKKLMLQESLAEACSYMLALMMQFHTEAKAFRLTDEKDKETYTWVDFRELTKVPATIPATEAFVKEFLENNPGLPAPQWQLMEGRHGKVETKDIDLDIQIDIGAGLPHNIAFVYQIAQQLGAMTIGGQPVMSVDEFRFIVKEILGLPLNGKPPVMTTNQKGEPVPVPPTPTQDANIEGMTASGKPAMQEQSGGGNSGNYYGTQPANQGSVGR